MKTLQSRLRVILLVCGAIPVLIYLGGYSLLRMQFYKTAIVHTETKTRLEIRLVDYDRTIRSLFGIFKPMLKAEGVITRRTFGRKLSGGMIKIDANCLPETLVPRSSKDSVKMWSPDDYGFVYLYLGPVPAVDGNGRFYFIK